MPADASTRPTPRAPLVIGAGDSGFGGDIVELRADTPTELAEGVSDLDAIFTSWGLRTDTQVIGAMRKSVALGVGSVGADMVDVAAWQPYAMSRGPIQ